jgi:SAM-dependent MidA family methyltransferase
MQRWGTAMYESLYGVSGFYRREQGESHFRTSVSASPLFADSLAALITTVDAALGRPHALQIVDVGAGDGTLLARLHSVLPADVSSRVEMTAVEVRQPPPELDPHIQWATAIPTNVVGVVIANEYLDNIPCDVVEADADVLRYVMVDAEGIETLGERAAEPDTTWLNEWWPLDAPGSRAEVGASRDDAWSEVVRSLERGAALAIDYGHTRNERINGGFPLGSLTGYRRGYQVVPTPDGTCDITAHVAVDSCEAAGTDSGATASTLIRQGHALESLGLTTQRPRQELARRDPAEYVRQLSRSSASVELSDPAALGAFWWLLQTKGVPLPIGTEALSG